MFRLLQILFYEPCQILKLWKMKSNQNPGKKTKITLLCNLLSHWVTTLEFAMQKCYSSKLSNHGKFTISWCYWQIVTQNIKPWISKKNLDSWASVKMNSHVKKTRMQIFHRMYAISHEVWNVENEWELVLFGISVNISNTWELKVMNFHEAMKSKDMDQWMVKVTTEMGWFDKYTVATIVNQKDVPSNAKILYGNETKGKKIDAW